MQREQGCARAPPEREGERERGKQRTRTAPLQSGAREERLSLTGAFEMGDPYCNTLSLSDDAEENGE